MKLKRYIAGRGLAAALWAALALVSCTNDDDGIPAGMRELRLGEVAIAGTAPAETRADGYTGVVKTAFVAGDALHIRYALSSDAATVHFATAVYDGASWGLTSQVLVPATSKVTAEIYYDGSATEITLPAEFDAILANGKSTSGEHTVYKDILKKELAEVSLVDGALPIGAMDHAMQLVRLEPRISGFDNNVLQQVVMNLSDGTKLLLSAEKEALVMPAAELKLTSLDVTLGDGTVYNVVPADPIVFAAAGASYTLRLTLRPGYATIVMGGSPSMEAWTAGEGKFAPTDIPAGYTPIYDLEGLQAIGNNLAGSYILMADIDMAGVSNWSPIGGAGTPFTGKFNGNGHVIRNMTVNNLVTFTGGALFGVLDGALIYNLHLRDYTPYDNETTAFVSGIAATANNSYIVRCSVTGSIDATNGEYRSALVYIADQSTVIDRCWAKVHSIDQLCPFIYEMKGGSRLYLSYTACTVGGENVPHATTGGTLVNAMEADCKIDYCYVPYGAYSAYLVKTTNGAAINHVYAMGSWKFADATDQSTISFGIEEIAKVYAFAADATSFAYTTIIDAADGSLSTGMRTLSNISDIWIGTAPTGPASPLDALAPLLNMN